MVTRFSAEEARQKVELAKKQAELDKQADQERKRKEDALREKQVRLQEAIDQGWETQKTLLIEAAVDGKKELVLEPPIYKFQSLIDVGVEFIEVGWVKNQEVDMQVDLYTAQEYRHRDEKILNLEDRIWVLGQDLIKAANSDWRKYYGSIEKYVATLNFALGEAIDSTSGTLDDDDELWVGIPWGLREKYSAHFFRITKEVQFLKKSRQNPFYLLPERVKRERAKMIHGDYFFSHQDKKLDILGERQASINNVNERVDESKNYYKAKWASDVIPDFLNDPIFTRIGLNWISAGHGQNLLEAIFDCLKDVAAKGKNATSLKFKLTSDGWYFLNNAGHHYQSCMPDDLVEIIARQDFKVVDTVSTAKSYIIKLRW